MNDGGPHLLLELPDGERLLMLDAAWLVDPDPRPSPEAQAAIDREREHREWIAQRRVDHTRETRVQRNAQERATRPPKPPRNRVAKVKAPPFQPKPPAPPAPDVIDQQAAKARAKQSARAKTAAVCYRATRGSIQDKLAAIRRATSTDTAGATELLRLARELGHL